MNIKLMFFHNESIRPHATLRQVATIAAVLLVLTLIGNRSNPYYKNTDSLLLASAASAINALYTNPLIDEPVQPNEPSINEAPNNAAPKINDSDDSSTKKREIKLVASVRRVNSIYELMKHLKNDSLHTLDFDYLVDFINGSPEAFDALTSEYRYSDDEIRKSLLLQLIDNVSNNEKIDFAFTLAQSNDSTERLKALRWLSHAPNQYDTSIVTVFADALENYENDSVLSDVMDFLVIPAEEDNPNLRRRVVSRLSELVDHSDEVIVEKSLRALVSESKTEEVEQLVLSKITSQSERIQLAAIEALYKFPNPSDAALETLNVAMSDPYAPQSVRASAVKAIVSIENKLNIQNLY